MAERLEIAAQASEVRRACQFIVEAAQASGLSDQAVYHCEVAVEEACANVIEHGAEPVDQSPLAIIIEARTESRYFVIVISDNSPPFNPLVLDDPDMESEVTKREPGGWGVYFFRKMMDAVSYDYSDGRNRLTLRKALPR